MDTILLGNIIALAGSVIMVLTGLIKTKKGILGAQVIMFILLTVANVILGGYTGAAANIVSILRNVLCFFLPFTVGWKLAFTAMNAVMAFVPALTGMTAGFSLIDGLPLIAAVSFTWFLDSTDGVILKLAIIFGQLMWSVYDFTIHNYTALAFDLMTVVTNVIGIVMIRRSKQQKTGG